MILYPKNATPIINTVVKDSPADKAGLKKQDRSLALNNNPINSENGPALVEQIMALPNQPVTFLVERDNQQFNVDLTLTSKNFLGKTVGSSGMILAIRPLPAHPFIQSFKEGIAFTNSLI